MAMDLNTMFGLAGELERLLSIPDEMEKMLQRPTRSYVKSAKAALRTPADIYEYPDHYSYLLDMPGLEPEDIKVTVAEGSLQVWGKKRKQEKTPISGGQAAPATTGEEGTMMPREQMQQEQPPLQTTEQQMQQPEQQGTATGVMEPLGATTAGGKPLHVERKRARHWRRFSLPQDADEDSVRALYKDGVLTVNVAKKPEVEKEKAKPRVVSIPVM